MVNKMNTTRAAIKYLYRGRSPLFYKITHFNRFIHLHTLHTNKQQNQIQIEINNYLIATQRMSPYQNISDKLKVIYHRT